MTPKALLSAAALHAAACAVEHGGGGLAHHATALVLSGLHYGRREAGRGAIPRFSRQWHCLQGRPRVDLASAVRAAHTGSTADATVRSPTSPTAAPTYCARLFVETAGYVDEQEKITWRTTFGTQRPGGRAGERL